MTGYEFERLRAQLDSECLRLLRDKGADYTDGQDVLSNFKDVAKIVGVHPLIVWYVYFSKHFMAVSSYIKNGSVLSEPIESRFVDLRNYIDLGYAILKENKT